MNDQDTKALRNDTATIFHRYGCRMPDERLGGNNTRKIRGNDLLFIESAEVKTGGFIEVNGKPVHLLSARGLKLNAGVSIPVYVGAHLGKEENRRFLPADIANVVACRYAEREPEFLPLANEIEGNPVMDLAFKKGSRRVRGKDVDSLETTIGHRKTIYLSDAGVREDPKPGQKVKCTIQQCWGVVFARPAGDADIARSQGRTARSSTTAAPMHVFKPKIHSTQVPAAQLLGLYGTNEMGKERLLEHTPADVIRDAVAKLLAIPDTELNAHMMSRDNPDPVMTTLRNHGFEGRKITWKQWKQLVRAAQKAMLAPGELAVGQIWVIDDDGDVHFTLTARNVLGIIPDEEPSVSQIRARVKELLGMRKSPAKKSSVNQTFGAVAEAAKVEVKLTVALRERLILAAEKVCLFEADEDEEPAGSADESGDGETDFEANLDGMLEELNGDGSGEDDSGADSNDNEPDVDSTDGDESSDDQTEEELELESVDDAAEDDEDNSESGDGEEPDDSVGNR